MFDAKVFTAEQIGKYTLVTLMLGEIGITVKMPCDFEGAVDATGSVRFKASDVFLVNAVSGQREVVKLPGVKISWHCNEGLLS